MPNVPAPCEALDAEVTRLTTLLTTLEQAAQRPPFDKGLIPEMATIGRQLAAAQEQLHACLVANGVPQDLPTSLVGTQVINIPSVMSSPFGVAATIPLFFPADRSYVQLQGFTDMSAPVTLTQTILGNTVASEAATATLDGRATGQGEFAVGSGLIEIPIYMSVTTKLNSTGTTVDIADITMLMTTGTTPDGTLTGQNLETPPDDTVMLVGSSTFSSGAKLNGAACTFRWVGSISPSPRP